MRIFGRDHSQPKVYFAGTHRSRLPEETVRDYGRHMPALGITRLANVTGLDSIGIPVYMAVRPNSRALSVSQGKGLDADSAKASALMESIESWHAEYIDWPLRVESYQHLARSLPLVDVTRLPLWSPGALRLDVPLPWIEGYDLLQQRPAWVPFEAVTSSTIGLYHTPPTFLVSSNGLASGNHLLEAVVHGLCEVLERDALSRWWQMDRARRDATMLDCATVADPACTSVLRRYDEAGVAVAAWDTTTDTGVPAYLCVIVERVDRPRWRNLPPFWGSGCHPDPAIALLRALTEAAQGRLTDIAGSRDDILPRDYTRRSGASHQADLRARIFGQPPVLSWGARRSLACGSFEGDVEVLLDALRRIGIDSAVVVDLTRPEIGVPVVKVTVPGLEISGHPSARPAPARAA